MSRQPRTFVPGVTYHLISRMVDRDWFIRTSEERETYIGLLARALSTSDWKLLAYAVMSNHLHFAAVAGEHSLDSWVRRVHAPFAGWLNRAHDRIGTIFVRGPKAFYVAATEVASLIAYIHNNPVRANVVSDATATDWTSHRAYVGLAVAPPWLRVDEGLLRCGFRTGGEFDEWVRSSQARGSRDPLFELLEQRTAYEVVDGEIVEKLREPRAPRVDADRLVARSAMTVGISVEQLCSRRRGAQERAARAVAVHAGRRLGLTGSEVARALGMTPQAISSIALRSAVPADLDEVVTTLRGEQSEAATNASLSTSDGEFAQFAI